MKIGTGEIWALIISKAIIIKKRIIGISQIFFDEKSKIINCLMLSNIIVNFNKKNKRRSKKMDEGCQKHILTNI